MPATHEIALFDTVELAEAVETAPAGSRGGVVDLLDDDMAMVEVMTMPLEPMLDRIVVAPLAKLRRIGHVATKPPDLMELTESFDGIPAGATGNLVGFKGVDKATVEITSIPELDEERIISPPLTKLRRIGAVRGKPKDVAA